MTRNIIITQRYDKIGQFREGRDNLDVRYIKLIEKLKLIPVPISNNIKNLKNILKHIKPCGIVLSSGGDPRKNDIRKKIEIKLIKHSIKNKVPILGICRGAQALNLFFGGKIKKITGHVRKDHVIKGSIYNKYINYKVNTFHDLGINRKNLAKNLVTNFISKDSNIECFSNKNMNILGIMWHPERYKILRKFEISLLKKFFKCN